VSRAKPPLSAYEALPDGAPLLTLALQRQATESTTRILEIGCGDGTLLLALATAFPQARIIGIELSKANVELAQARAVKAGLSKRIAVVCGDWITISDLGRFDAILAQSVLHLIEHPDNDVFARLNGDLADGGLVVATLPYDCARNRALWWLRRRLRTVRGSTVDRFFLRIAMRLHPELPRELLAQRIPYMRMLARRSDGPAMREIAHRLAALTVIEERPLRAASIAQPLHRLLVMRKESA